MLTTAAGVAAFGALLLASGLRIPIRSVTVAAPLLLLLAIGLVGAWDHAARDVMRDVWLVGRAALVVALGAFAASRTHRLGPVLAALAAASLPVAAWHLLQFVLQPGLLALPVGHIRNVAGAGSILSPIVLGAAFAYRRHLGRLPTGPHWLWRAAVWANAGSLLLSFSRTGAVCLFLIVLAAWPRRRDAAVRRAVNWKAVLLVGAALVALSQALDPTYAREFVGKIGRSAVELVASNPGAMEQINDNWRGYELYRALQQYGRHSTPALFFGTGMGTLVDLGFAIPLGGEDASPSRFIPILHNAYGMLLVKVGAVGVALYVGLLVGAAWVGLRAVRRLPPGEGRVSGHLLVGVALCTLATSATVAGLFNNAAELDALGLMLGAAWAAAGTGASS